MDRNTNTHRIGPKAGLIITTALASVALAGCSTSTAPRAETSFSKAQTALKSGKSSKAIAHAEEAVLAEPRNPGFRAMLGAAYLEEGRFEAAATSFNDALELGDTDPRTTLSFALAKIAVGDSASAIAALRERENRINPADFGLALALAGQPEQAVHVLTNALRAGQNTAKMRQNLAYTYALAGNWRAARVMAAEDVPADQLNARLAEWAADAKPEDVMKRVAKLLGVTPTTGGQPAQLALANFPSHQAMVAQAAAEVETPMARELDDSDLAQAAPAKPSQSEVLAFGMDTDDEAEAPVATIKASPKPPVVRVAAAEQPAAPRFVSKPVVQDIGNDVPAAPAPITPVKVAAKAETTSEVLDPTVANILRATGAKTADAAAPVTVAASNAVATPAARFISKPVVQDLPEAAPERKAPRRVANSSSQRRMAAPTPTRVDSGDKGADSHLVQLGSYNSRSEATAGWNALQGKFPQLKGHDVVITKANVKGKIYYRVAAAGFGPRSARSMCGTVKSAGRGCFAYAASNPPAGAIDDGVRIAARTR